jgi:hypothetical protein
LPPRLQSLLDEAATIWRATGANIEPADSVITTKPRPLPSHVAPGAHERLLPRVTQLVGVWGRCPASFLAGVQCGEHLGVAERAGGGDPVAQALA